MVSSVRSAARWLAAERPGSSGPAPTAARLPRTLLDLFIAILVPLALLLALGALAGPHADQFLFVPVVGVAVVALARGVAAGLVATAIAIAGCARLSSAGGDFEVIRIAGLGVVSALVATAAGSLRDAYRRAAEERAAAERLAERLAREHAETERAVSLRDQVLAVVSHDLKAPLASISIGAERLARRLGEQMPDARRLLEAIRRRTEEMSRLIQDLVDVASIEAGRLSMRPEPRDPRQIAREAIDAISLLAQERGLRVALEESPALPEITCDGGRVLQVLSNLLGNAVKVTPSGGTVTLEVAPATGEVRFSVRDTGPGIARDDLPHVFERFRRGRDVGYAGAGLGLAIAKGIVEAHRGWIAAESTPGAGARFTFGIPAGPGPASSASPAGRQSSGPASSAEPTGR